MKRSLLLSLSLVLTCAPLPAVAGDPPPGRAPLPKVDSANLVTGSSVTTTLLESKIKEVESSVELDEATKTKLTELYRKSLSSLEAAKSYDSKTAGYSQAMETAPDRVAELRREIDAIQERATKPPAPIPEDLGIRELQQRLAKDQADAAAAEAKVSEMQKELDKWAQRPAEARQRITQAKTALEDLGVEASRPPPEEGPPAVAEARRWVLETRQRELRAEILMHDRELLSQGPRHDRLQAERDKSALDLKLLQASRRALEEQLIQRRQVEAAQAKAEAQAATREAAGKHPLVQKLAEQNAALTEELAASAAALDKLTRETAAAEDRSMHVAEEFRSARQRLEISGVTQALGQVLLDRRQSLPDARVYRRAAQAREVAIAEASLRQIRHNEERLALRDPDAYLYGLLQVVPPAERTEALRAELRGLVERRRELLDQTQAGEDAYLRALGELDYASNQLMRTVQSYEGFLAERLLWVRSSAPVGRATITDLPSALAWALSPINWLEVVQLVVYEATSSPLLWLQLLPVLALYWKARTMRSALMATAEPLRRVRTEGFRYTLQGLALTALLAAPLPLLTAALGWQLTVSVEATAFTKAIGAGVLAVSTGLFTLRAFYLLCVSGGVAERHFLWSGAVLKVIRRNFSWAIPVLIPLGFVASVFHSYEDLSYSGSLGRLAVVALMLGLAVFTARLAHPAKGVFQNLLALNPHGMAARLRKLWYPLVVAAPLALVALTLAGYTYTAGTLLTSLVSELWVVLGLTVLHQSVVRWLIVTRRRLSLEAAMERRAARAAAEETRGEARAAATAPPAEEPEVDLASLDEQTRRLINALMFFGAALSLWAIWSEVLPAFAVLRDVALWHYTGVVDGKEAVIPVTLASIGLVIVIAAAAAVAARNLPALLEILLLRTSISAGSRYAVRTLTGYVITLIAALAIFSTLGLSWGQVQWLVAALSVGIGFGLQEIVANFISGIIILFERPVRVGDVVTVGDITGTVTRIQIRAITIRNWDRQELLVPNKEFITGRLLNWTLSDTVNRVLINVGVDYGSDVRLALKLMEEAVREDERILTDPPPTFSFEGFGDNSLSLVVRVYLGTLDDRLSVITQLHHRINDKLRTHGIDIAFPQRDIHLSAAQPLDVRIHSALTPGGAAMAKDATAPGSGAT